MIHASLIPSLLASVANGKIRPSLEYINIDGQGRYESTDSYHLTRITPKKTNANFPSTSSLFAANPIWSPVSLTVLINACDKAILLAKQKKESIAHIVFNGNESSTIGEPFTISATLPHQSPTGFDAKILIKFLKPIKAQTTPLEWYQETPLSPLNFRMDTNEGLIEYLIMPVKLAK